MPTALKSAPSRKAFVFTEVKTLDDEQGIFEGYLSVFGNSDSYKDIVDFGSFKKTINDHEQARKTNNIPYLFPILWQHNPSDPIGGFTNVSEDPKGLFVKAQLDLDIEQGRRAYSALKKQYVQGLSIGYDTIKEEWKDGFRHLKEIRLWEGSVVTFGANEDALVNGVKSSGKHSFNKMQTLARDFNAVVSDRAESDLFDMLYDNFSALSTSMMEIYYDGDETNKPDAVGSSVDQFRDAMMNWASSAQAMCSDDAGTSDPTGEDDLNAVTSSYYMSTNVALRLVKFASQTMHLQTKEGRTISGATRTRIDSAIAQMKTALEELSGLIGGTESEIEPQDLGKDAPLPVPEIPVPEEHKEEELEGPKFLKLLMDAMSTQSDTSTETSPSSPSENTKSALTTSDINEDAKLMQLVKQISAEANRIVIGS